MYIMKKAVLGMLVSLWLSFWFIFANILPDSAEIWIKDQIIQWEAANLTITVMKDWSKMSSYTGTVFMMLTEQDWWFLSPNEYTLPNLWIYTFLESDLWSKEFQKWVEVKKEWKFYLEVSDLDTDEILWKQLITVVKQWANNGNSEIKIINPSKDATLVNEKVEILWEVPELPNSEILVYIDNESVSKTVTDAEWFINHWLTNIEPGKHVLKLEAVNFEWETLWVSEEIPFTYTPQTIEWFKDIIVDPEEGLLVNDIVKITVHTDEMVESVKLSLSDRPDNDSIVLSKETNWEFTQNVFLLAAGDVKISLELSALNNSDVKKYDNVKTITVKNIPAIDDVRIDTDEVNQTAEIIWDLSNWPVSSYLVKWRLEWWTQSWENRTTVQSFKFKDVPYDTPVYLEITPYLSDLTKHWTASKTIQFVLTKPAEEKCGNGVVDEWETCSTCPIDLGTACQTPEPIIHNPEPTTKTPRCRIQNISTRTAKIWNSYYLIWDKVENVSKYIVYSSTTPTGSDKVKVYETSDTSYEYPFDATSENDKFAYFRIEWICDDWEELQLTGATKVQVWPAENFFLLMCVTFLIYFWIKLFRQTED